MGVWVSKQKRREQAILVQNEVTWKLREAQKMAIKEGTHEEGKTYNHTRTLRDVANAFPSPGHKQLTEAIVKKMGRGISARILVHRVREAEVSISERSGKAIIL